MAEIQKGVSQRLNRAPISIRLLIGNAVVVVLVTTGGIVLARTLSEVNPFVLALCVSLVGILLTQLVSYFTIKIALGPLRDLRTVVEQVQVGNPSIPGQLIDSTPPDVQPLVVAIQSMLERLETYSDQLRALSERVISAQEDERKRIARGLHDDTAQALSSLIIQLERMEKSSPNDHARLKKRLGDARRLATLTLEDLRKIIYGLRPSMLDDLGLIPAIRWYARSVLDDANVNVQFDTPSKPMRLRPYLETLLFRIAQEGVNNVLRHSNARNVTIRLLHEDSTVRLEVIDDGQGFDVSRSEGLALPQKQLGLLGIRERMVLVGGEATIDSSPGRGTVLRVSMPLLTEETDRSVE